MKNYKRIHVINGFIPKRGDRVSFSGSAKAHYEVSHTDGNKVMGFKLDDTEYKFGDNGGIHLTSLSICHESDHFWWRIIKKPIIVVS